MASKRDAKPKSKPEPTTDASRDTGTDTAEFIEMYATAGAPLAGWTLDFFNGNASTNGDTAFAPMRASASTANSGIS